MAWTNQQQNAIDARNSSIIVPAAAGSGKTAVLTERLINLIADKASGVRADRIVVVTFTNDAASELKTRLYSKLRALINQNPSDTYLLKQQTLLQNAKISTINSFCLDLIRDNISEQGITSGFSVLDETDNAVLKSQAMEDLLNYYSENEYEKISYLYDRFCIKNETRLKEAISLTDRFLASVAMGDKWLDKAVSEYEKKFEDSVYYTSLIESLKERIQKALETADDCIGMINKIFPDMTVSAAEKSYAQAESDYDRVSDYLAVLRTNRLPDAAETELVQNFDALVRVGKTEHDKELRETYKKKRDRIKKLITKAVESIGSVESDFEESGKVVRILAETVKKYQEIVWAKKCEKNAVSFDDGERLALELLADTDENGNIVQSETALRTSEYYDIIMIDEYQDSNNKQDLIFKLLSKNFKVAEDGKAQYGDNVFLVGDVKQSIYRFRLANPRNFIETLKSSEPYDEKSSAPNKSIFLNMNFRSSENVIDFVNYMFSEIMTEKCGDIEYTDDEKLYFGASQYNGTEDEISRTEISFIREDSDEDEETEKQDSDINIEAVFTAEKIAEMLKNEHTVVEKDGSRRKCRPSDFCILVRKNKHINIYADELTRLGISAKGSEESGYLRAREIAVLIDLLRVINNPLLDISLTAVLASPMYMFSIQELAYLKSLDKEKPLYSVIRALINGEFEECRDTLLIKRCSEFIDSLSEFRLNSVTMTIGELISSIYDTTDFISVMQMYADGEKKRANLRALIQYAQGYESSVAFEGSGGLNGFLQHLDRVMENGDYAQGKTASSSGDYVSVLTLHRSKGLEFPFVFIAETSCKFNYDSDIVMCSADGEIGCILYDPKIYRRYKTFQQVMLAEKEQRDTRSEEMRLLYVGLTRAKQKLFINLKCGEKAIKRVSAMADEYVLSNGKTEDIVCSADYFSDWIWAVLMKSGEFPKIAEELGIELSNTGMFKTDEKKLFDYSIVNGVSGVETSEKTETETAVSDDRIYREIEKVISNEYDRKLSETPAKLSVTQIISRLKDENESFDYKLKRPRFKSDNTKLSGAERGIAVHAFFQYCSFDGTETDYAKMIDDVRQNGFLSQAEADAISPKKVKAFFNSELFRRIKSAGENVWREKQFTVAVADLDIDSELIELLRRGRGMIMGVADLIFEEDGELILVDYKTDKGMTESAMCQKYKVQLMLYKAAIELTMNKKVRQAYLYSFELERAVEIEL